MVRVRPPDPDFESLDETYRGLQLHAGTILEAGLRLSQLLTAAKPGGRRLPGLDPDPRADR